MNKQEMLGRIYEEISYSSYRSETTTFWEHCGWKWWIMIWDCLDYLEQDDKYDDWDIVSDVLNSWKNKRLPIDKEEEVIKLMYNLINK